MKHFHFFFLLFFLSGMFSYFPVVHAESLVGDDLVKVGIQYYEQGEYAKAVHEFSKALLVDPKNETARVYLRKMGIEEGLYGRQHPPLEQVGEMSGKILEYEKEVEFLNQEKEQQAATVQQMAEEKAKVEQALTAKDEETQKAFQAVQEAEARRVESEKLANEMKARVGQKGQEVVRLNADLYQMKDRVLAAEKDVEAMKAKQEEAQQWLRYHEEEFENERVQYEEQQWALQKQVERDRHEAQVKETELKDRLEKTHERLLETVNQADLMRDELVVANYKLANLESMMMEKEKNNLRQQEAFREMQAKISFLQERLEEESPARVDEKGLSVKGQASTVDFIKKQDAQIAELKQQLIATRESLQEVRAMASAVKGDESSALNTKISEMAEELARTKSLYADKDSEYQVLEQRLKTLQERLAVVEGMLKDRDSQMKQMEDQLTNDLLKMEDEKR